tara:strand:- start:2319 stop:3248 length:930 start_codon:yes stop_codon:yes gene_type:complete
MPETKFKNLSQADELVPMDTDGEEVEIELEEGSTTTIKSDVVEEMIEENNNEEIKDETEHEEYSKGVQKRIDKLTAKLREAERREQAATSYAQNVQQENTTLKTKTEELDNNYILAEANRITAETEKAKSELRAANENDDIDKQTDAQQRLAVLAGEAQRVQAINKQKEKAETEIQTPSIQQQQTSTEQPVQYADPDPKAQTWAEENEWFGQDRAMTMTSFAIHQELVDEGIDPTGNQYYTEIDKRIRNEFPHKFDEDSSPKTRTVQTVASAKRSAKTGRSKSVKLTPSQVAIAKKLGVPLEEYAKYVK